MQMKSFYRAYRRTLKKVNAKWNGDVTIWVQTPDIDRDVCPLNLVRNVKFNPETPTYLGGAVQSGKALGLTEDQCIDIITAADHIRDLTPRQRQIRAALLRAVQPIKL
jgi:hypothetical protein